MTPYISDSGTPTGYRLRVACEVVDLQVHRRGTTRQKEDTLDFLEGEARNIAARDHPEVDPAEYIVTRSARIGMVEIVA